MKQFKHNFQNQTVLSQNSPIVGKSLNLQKYSLQKSQLTRNWKIRPKIRFYFGKIKKNRIIH
jgi:hypothetical protein